MLWVRKRTISMRWFFWAPKTYAKNYGYENINNFMQKIFTYLNLRYVMVFLKELYEKVDLNKFQTVKEVFGLESWKMCHVIPEAIFLNKDMGK